MESGVKEIRSSLPLITAQYEGSKPSRVVVQPKDEREDPGFKYR